MIKEISLNASLQYVQMKHILPNLDLELTPTMALQIFLTSRLRFDSYYLLWTLKTCQNPA